MEIYFNITLRWLGTDLSIFAAMPQFAHDTIVPDRSSNLPKKEQVARMFNSIAPRYDLLNRTLSAGIDVGWRKKAIRLLAANQPQMILDVATGTGDLAITAHHLLHPKKIIGIDISTGMLEHGNNKIKELGLSQSIELVEGDSEAIQFPDGYFDAVMVAFGVRNFQDLDKGIAEIHRVLRPGGQLMVLEFSQPKLPFIKQLYRFYMNVVTPGIGGILSNNRDAYQYLNDSVRKFPEGTAFIQVLEQIGFKETTIKRLSLGICSMYTGIK